MSEKHLCNSIILSKDAGQWLKYFLLAIKYPVTYGELNLYERCKILKYYD